MVADSLEFNAEAALQGVTSMEDRGNIELRETLGDIRSQAYFGLYWANKIRGAYELALFRKNKDPKNKEAAVAFLTKSYEEWMRYADQLDASYEKVRFAAHGVFDWYEVAEEVKKDIEIARLAE